MDFTHQSKCKPTDCKNNLSFSLLEWEGSSADLVLPNRNSLFWEQHLQSGLDLFHQLKMGWDFSSSFACTSMNRLDLCLCPSGLLQEFYQAKQERGKGVVFETGKSYVWYFCSLLCSPTCQASFCDPRLSSLARSNSGCRDIAADATDKLRHQYETSHRLGDAKSEPARSAPTTGTHSAAHRGKMAVAGGRISNLSVIELESESKLGTKARGGRKFWVVTVTRPLLWDLAPFICLPKDLRWANDVFRLPSWGEQDHRAPTRVNPKT